MADNENKQPAGSRRMKILQQSLVKKQAAFDQPLGTPKRRFADGGQGN